MPRVSRKMADQHRKDILQAAARLFRQHGIDGISLPGIMAEAGLTHGAFYGHFASKEALAAEACQSIFNEKCGGYEKLREKHGKNMRALRTEYITRYLSGAHRDAPGMGCPAVALAADASRDGDRSQTRAAFAGGLDHMIDSLSEFMSSRQGKARREDTLASFAMLVGALTLARATKGQPMSDEILKAVQKALLDR